jgi:hypothetical protein
MCKQGFRSSFGEGSSLSEISSSFVCRWESNSRLALLESRSFRSACGRAGHFLLLRQEKVTKEKATPMPRLSGAARQVRERIPGFVACTSMYMQRTDAHPARHSDELSCMRSPRQEGAQDQEQSTVEQSTALVFALPLISGPLQRAEHRRLGRGNSESDRDGSRSPSVSTRTCCREGPAQPRSAGYLARSARRGVGGVLSFGDFSLHKQRKVTRSPEGEQHHAWMRLLDDRTGFQLALE